MFGYIPSPSANGFNIGPLRLHAYGFIIVLGVFAAVWLADRRWRARGGEPGTFSNIAVWAVPAGLIGARLYSVITDYELYDHHLVGALEIWKGGLGIWGGIAGGALGAWLYVRRHHLDWGAIADCVAPALPLAQAIGRWGNYFNQELFGRPTTLPWGLKIDPTIVANLFSNVNKSVPEAYVNAKAFQPTFLYECIWDLIVVFLVLWAEKHIRLRKGYLFWVYVACYTFGRFFTEYLRIDFAHKFLGLRLNDWTSIVVFLLAVTLLLARGRIRGPEPSVEVEVAEPARERAPVAVAAGAPGASTVPGGDTLDDEGIGSVIADRAGSSASEDEDASGSDTRGFAAIDTSAAVAEAATAVPDPAPTDSPAAAEAAPTAAEAVPAAPEPLPAAPEPETTAVAPLPVAPEPTPVAAEPETTAAEPEPTPAAVVTSEPTVADADLEPAPAETAPGSGEDAAPDSEPAAAPDPAEPLDRTPDDADPSAPS